MNHYVTGACFVVWILISFWGLVNIVRFFRALFFHSVEGTVTATGEHQETWDGETTTYYYFEYRFELDGKEFVGNSSNSFIGSHGGMQKDEKQPGDPVKILFNPRDPAENYSSCAGFYGGVFLVAFAQLFLLLGIHCWHTFL